MTPTSDGLRDETPNRFGRKTTMRAKARARRHANAALRNIHSFVAVRAVLGGSA